MIVLQGKTELVVTHDLSQDDAKAVRQACKIRWKIQEFHRKIKQLTGIEHCQSRKEKIQKNHLGCAIRVWGRLKNLAYPLKRDVYELWQSQYEQFLTGLLHPPSLALRKS